MPALISQVATRRLIEGSATLEPVDRALLNMWINRGLDDDAIARLACLPPDSIVARRASLVAHLSDELGLPPATVFGALQELAASARTGPPPAGEVQAVAEPAAPSEIPAINGDRSAVARVAEGGPPASESPDSGTPPAGRRRGAFLILLAGAVAVVVVVVVIVVLASATAGHSGAAVHTNTTPPQPGSASVPTTKTQPTQTQTQPVHKRSHRRTSHHRPPRRGASHRRTSHHRPPRRGASHRRAVRRVRARPNPSRRTLVELPGSGQKATGSVTLIGPSDHPRLQIAANGLAPTPSGGYEIWLYNSILDSQPLAQLTAPASRIVATLPANYRRYKWLDVSYQPSGTLNHSGLSILRAANPHGS